MLEKDIEKKLAKAVSDQGGIAYKFTSPGRRGVPDRLIVFNDKIAFVELKTSTGRLSALQVYELDRLTYKGQRCYVLNDPENIGPLIDDIRADAFPALRYRATGAVSIGV